MKVSDHFAAEHFGGTVPVSMSVYLQYLFTVKSNFVDDDALAIIIQ